MTQDEIIPLPTYLNAAYEGDDLYTGNQVRELMKLVAAKERETYMQLFLDPENQPTQYGTVTVKFMNREIAKEREACAKVAENRALVEASDIEKIAHHTACKNIAKEIRDRGEA
jgi:dTDP-glucose pyrophosphorylase